MAGKSKAAAVQKGLELTTGSVEETQAFGERLGRLLRAGDVLALSGELGTGKTTLIQGIARGLGRRPEAVKSPTFVLMREYPPGPTHAGAGGEVPLVHVDGYRLEGAPAALQLDPEWLFSPHQITVIEWAERFTGLLPESHLEMQLAHVSTNRRRILLHPSGVRAVECISQLQERSAHDSPLTTSSGTFHADSRD